MPGDAPVADNWNDQGDKSVLRTDIAGSQLYDRMSGGRKQAC